MTRFLKYSLAFFTLSLLLGGCSSLKTIRYSGVYLDQQAIPMAENLTETQQKEIKKLTLALDDLGLKSDVKTSPIEAERIAWSAVLYPLHLANQYRLTSPPLFHNSLVNSGLREKGLCVDWTADMMRHMMKLKLKTYDLHWGVANLGNPFTEHNSLIVTAKGQDFASGLLLDPWRDSGQLYWALVKEDSKYQWVKYN